MPESHYKVYPYRWVVLAVFMLINLVIQILWISYAPITGMAASYYGVSDLQIGLLAMSFMIAFIPLSIPVSWAIDTYGFRPPVSLGAVLMGIFGVLRGLAGANYTLVLLSTIGIAIAQPFLLNAWTKVPARWFWLEERATAVGLVTLANLVGTGIGMALTPELVEDNAYPDRPAHLRRTGGDFSAAVPGFGPRDAAHGTLPAGDGNARPDVRWLEACPESEILPAAAVCVLRRAGGFQRCDHLDRERSSGRAASAPPKPVRSERSCWWAGCWER